MSEQEPSVNAQIFKVMYAMGNVPMSVDAIRLTAGLPFKVVHEALLKLHRMGHVNGRQIAGLEIPVEKKIQNQSLFGMEKIPKRGRKERSKAT